MELSSKTMAIPSLLAVLSTIYWLTWRTRTERAGHSRTMSPDTVSSLFPDRPIRPLPKRRLRERLSPEIAGSIKYPPSTHQNPVPLFHYPPYTVRDDGSPPRFGLGDGSRRVDLTRNYTPRRGGEAVVSGEEADTNSRSSLVARSSPEILSRASLQQAKSDQPQPLFAPAPPSVTSSVDGYDSFENTSNKKKRKIPSAADSALNTAHGLVTDIGSNPNSGSGVSVHDMPDSRFYNNVPSYSAPVTLGSGSQGMSGSGRGRLGRVRSGRSPLGALPDGNMAWSGRMPKPGNALWASGMFLFLLALFAFSCPTSLCFAIITLLPVFHELHFSKS